MTLNIIDFVTDPQLLGLSISPAQQTLLRSIYGLPLDEEQLDLWHRCTGRDTYPQRPFAEVTVIAGARAGKDSRIAAPIVCFEALFGGHEKHLAKGERGVIPLIAQDGRATRIAFGYIRDYLTTSKLLESRVVDVKAQEIALDNRISINCFPCTLASTRGFSCPAGVLDEVGFFRLEGQADSDAEVQASVRRGMLSFPETRLVKISTPYLKSGILFDDFRRGFGQDDPDLLVWKASSIEMNPGLGAERLERERRLDAGRFAREYEAEWQDDLSAFLPGAWVEEAVVRGRHELPPRENVTYLAACDPSGGGADHFTFTIVHKERDKIVQDVLRGFHRVGTQAPDLASCVREIAETLQRYRLREISGDRYSGQWVRQEFERARVRYKDADLDRSRSFLECESLFAQGRIELLDHPQQTREFRMLEKRARPGGRAEVTHPRGGRDDYANSLALGVARVLSRDQQATFRIRPL